MKNQPMGLRQAFTLIELIAAVLLGTMLLAAIIAVMRLTANHQSRLRAMEVHTESNSMLLAQIRRDIINSESAWMGPNSLWLAGGIARDLRSGQAVHQKAYVHYQVREVLGRRVLIRTQVAQFDQLVPTMTSEPVWMDVGGFRVLTNSMEWDDLPDSNFPANAVFNDPLFVDQPSSTDDAAPGNMKTTPGSLRVQVFHENGYAVLDETIVHHTETDE